MFGKMFLRVNFMRPPSLQNNRRKASKKRANRRVLPRSPLFLNDPSPSKLPAMKQ
jgi:hypothetical protein